jgi:hypothetical protein
MMWENTTPCKVRCTVETPVPHLNLQGESDKLKSDILFEIILHQKQLTEYKKENFLKNAVMYQKYSGSRCPAIFLWNPPVRRLYLYFVENGLNLAGL